MSESAAKKPVRVGIFDTMAQADEAISKLLDVGFEKENLAVIAAEPAATHFRDEGLQDEQPARTAPRAATGGAVGSALGALGAVGLVTTGGLGVLAAGFLVPAVISGGIAGSFLGAMTTRGVDKEAADFYNQMVEKGKFLVVIEDRSESANQTLPEAERILSESGAIPIPLRSG